MVSYKLFVASYYSFLSEDIKMKKYKIMIIILIFVENCLWYDAINDFSVWLRTGSYPADLIGFEVILEKKFMLSKRLS